MRPRAGVGGRQIVGATKTSQKRTLGNRGATWGVHVIVSALTSSGNLGNNLASMHPEVGVTGRGDLEVMRSARHWPDLKAMR